MKELIIKWLGIYEIFNKIRNLKQQTTKQGKKIQSLNERIRKIESVVNKLHNKPSTLL